MMAIVEREMRKFFRSPALMLVAMVFPLVQLLVLGNAFGGKIRDAKVGLVDEDGGTQALRIRDASKRQFFRIREDPLNFTIKQAQLSEQRFTTVQHRRSFHEARRIPSGR
jgi:hypothetical protein